MNFQLTKEAKAAILDGSPLVADGTLHADMLKLTNGSDGKALVELYKGDVCVATLEVEALRPHDQLRLAGFDIRIPLGVS